MDRKQELRTIETEELISMAEVTRATEKKLFAKWNEEKSKRGNLERARAIRDIDKELLEELLDILEVLEERGILLSSNVKGETVVTKINKEEK